MKKKVIYFILIALIIGGLSSIYIFNKQQSTTTNNSIPNNINDKKSTDKSNKNSEDSISENKADSKNNLRDVSGNIIPDTVADDSSEDNISNESIEKSKNEVKSVSEALDESIITSQVDSDFKRKEVSKIFEKNNNKKIYNQELINLLGTDSINMDLNNSDNLDKYIEYKLHVNTKEEAIDLYKKRNPVENRTPSFTFNESNISNVSLHSGGKSQYNYDDFKDYNGLYIRLENCTYDYIYGGINLGSDSLYPISLYAYYPTGNGLEKDLNLKLFMDYSDKSTLNHSFSKNEKFTIEGKVFITKGDTILTLNKCRIIK